MKTSAHGERQRREALWLEAERAGVSRRRFLGLVTSGGAAAVLAGCGGPEVVPPAAAPLSGGPVKAQAPIVKPTPGSDFILHGSTNAEMRFEVMARQTYATPNAAFFVRSHGATPIIDVKAWRLIVEGDGVEKPFELTYDELLKMPSKTIPRYIECAGNGRAFYEKLLQKKAKGDPWLLGGFGIAEWTGVPLSEVLRRAGVKQTAVEVMPVGLDDSGLARPMPISKAMEEDTLLAYRMNGEELPPDHGFPVRAVVSGWVGVASVKWVGRLQVSQQPISVKWNTEEYVLIGPDYPALPPAKGPMVTAQAVKSAVALPWNATLRPGRQTVVGYAWSPFGKIAGVEVSLDGGSSFRPATLVGPNIERAGVRWEISFEAGPGDRSILPRATDDQGNAQPALAAQKWNEKGYLFGAAVPHPIVVGG